MPKTQHATQSFDAAAVQTLDLADIPDQLPTLTEGRWALQFVGYKVETRDGNRGPYTQVSFWLDPVEPVSVDDVPEGYEDMRQFHRLYMTTSKDMIAVKQFLRAFGVTTGALTARAEDGSVTYPAFETARGNVAHATAREGIIARGSRAGQTELKLSDFTPAA